MANKWVVVKGKERVSVHNDYWVAMVEAQQLRERIWKLANLNGYAARVPSVIVQVHVKGV